MEGEGGVRQPTGAPPLPVPSPPRLSSSRGGAGYVERGRARELLRVRPERTGAPALAARGNLAAAAAAPQVWGPPRGA